MTSQIRDPYHDLDNHRPFLKVARVLYENAQFVISSARPFSVFRCVPVSKFEKDRGEYNEEQVKA